MVIKIKLSSGKELEFTKEELEELLGNGKNEDPYIPYIPHVPNYPWYPWTTWPYYPWGDGIMYNTSGTITTTSTEIDDWTYIN